MKARFKAFIQELIYPPSLDMPQRDRDRLRRRREFAMAGGAVCLILILTWILFYLYDTGSALFITVFSLNFILLLAVALVVIRNGLKLILDRQHGVLGSRLRTRLSLAFVALTFAPCVLMFVITTKFVQLSVDFWFKDQVTTSMETALEVGRVDYEKTVQRLQFNGQRILKEISERRIAWGSQAMTSFLSKKQQEERFPQLELLSSTKEERKGNATQDALLAWDTARDSLSWGAIREQGYQAVLASGIDEDFVIGALAVNGGNNGYLIIAESMGPGYKGKLDRIATGSSEYKQLWRMKRAMKWMLYVNLGVLTLLIVLGAVWFGFRVAKEISAPVLALAEATDRIAKGDLSVRLGDYSTDELGQLIRSFNRMAADIEASRSRLTNANDLLEQQNRQIVQHSNYIETVLDNITSGVMSIDSDGRITMVNKAACSILGNTPRKLIGHALLDLLPDDMTVVAHAMFEQFKLRPLSRWQREITLSIAKEERRLLVSAVGLLTPEGLPRGFVAVFDDVSEQERMQRMAAWREVARRIAHEIKNPLTPIKLSAQRLQRKFGGQVVDPAFQQSTSLIVREVESLQEMVQEFSSFAKLPEVNPTPGDILPLLQETANFFRNSHSHITWELFLPSSLPILPMDKKGLHRAFMNVFANAVDAINARAEETGSPPNAMPFHPIVRISASIEEELGLVRIDVEDSGRGLTEEERVRLFEPYFSRKKGGTGLGLPIVKSIVSDHKGYIRSGQGNLGGAVITIELPFA